MWLTEMKATCAEDPTCALPAVPICSRCNAGSQAAAHQRPGEDASPLHARMKRLKRNQKGDAVPSRQHHAESALRMNNHVHSNTRFENMKQKADHSKVHRR